MEPEADTGTQLHVQPVSPLFVLPSADWAELRPSESPKGLAGCKTQATEQFACKAGAQGLLFLHFEKTRGESVASIALQPDE